MDAPTRVIALVDMDCFYVQVEQRSCPDFLGKPTVVAQYNPFKTGGIIAVGYEARAKGVKRGMSIEEALSRCPDLNVVTAAHQRDKADLTKYRNASLEIFSVLSAFDRIIVERASIDEAYLDLTEAVELELRDPTTAALSLNDFPTSYLAVSQNEDDFGNFVERAQNDEFFAEDKRLLVGAAMVEKIRRRIFEETKFHCSAGVAHNKTLAKLVCALHKPKQQTILPRSLISALFIMTPISNIRMLGGKLGKRVMEEFSISTMAELSTVPFSSLVEKFGENSGNWLKNIAQGIDNEPVTPRQLPKSIGCSKNFPGRNSLKTKSNVNKWLSQLAEELEERLVADLQANRRVAKTLVVGLRTENDSAAVSCTRQTALNSYSALNIIHESNKLLKEFNMADKDADEWRPPLINLSLAAGKFEDSVDLNSAQITNFFKKSPTTKNSVAENDESSLDKTPTKPPMAKSAVSFLKSDWSPCDSASKSDSESFFKRIMKNRSAEKLAQRTDDEKTRDSVELRDTVGPSTSKALEMLPTVFPGALSDTVENFGGSKSAEREKSVKCKEAVGLNFGTIVCPPNRNDIDPEVWRDLTPQIRFELINFYKKQSRTRSNGDESQERLPKKPKRRESEKCRIRTKTDKISTRPPKKPVTSDINADTATTLFDFYDKL